MISAFGRFKALVASSAIPGVVVGLACDLLTPIHGGWLAVGFGLAAVALLVQHLAKTGQDRSWAEFLTGGERKSKAWWSGKHWQQHGVHALALFSVVAVGVGMKSLSAVESGGWVASESEKFAAFQRQVLATERMAADIAVIRDEVGEGKKEISKDPAKELVNFGFSAEPASMIRAVSADRHDLIPLFEAAGVPPPARAYDDLLKHHAANGSTMAADIVIQGGFVGALVLAATQNHVSEETTLALSHYLSAHEARHCMIDGNGIVLAAELAGSDDASGIYRAICGNAANLDAIAEISGQISAVDIGFRPECRREIGQFARSFTSNQLVDLQGKAFQPGAPATPLNAFVVELQRRLQQQGDVTVEPLAGGNTFRANSPAMDEIVEASCDRAVAFKATNGGIGQLEHVGRVRSALGG